MWVLPKPTFLRRRASFTSYDGTPAEYSLNRNSRRARVDNDLGSCRRMSPTLIRVMLPLCRPPVNEKKRSDPYTSGNSWHLRPRVRGGNAGQAKRYRRQVLELALGLG